MSKLSDKEIQYCKGFANIMEAVGDKVATYQIIYRLCQGYTSDFLKRLPGDYLDAIAEGDSAVNKLIENIRIKWTENAWPDMDPFTVADIVIGLWWPAIKELTPGMIDHPDDGKMDSMNGVCRNWIFNTEGNGLVRGGELEKMFPGKTNWADDFEIFFDEVLKVTNPVDRAAQAYDICLYQLNAYDSSFDDATSKHALSLMYASDKAALCRFAYQCSTWSVGHPLYTMAFWNPYFGFLNAWVAWMGGGFNVIQEHGIQAAINKLYPLDGNLRKFYNSEGSNNTNRGTLQDEILGDNPEKGLARCVNITNVALKAQYEWLQGAKQTNNGAKYYQQWYDDFFTKPRSLVNMCVVINELVNIDSAGKYKHSLPCKQKLAKLGAAYTTGFKIILGDS